MKIVDNGNEIRITSLLFHQGTGMNNESLIQFAKGAASNSDRNVFFYDLFCRAGGPKTNNGIVNMMMQVGASGVVGDNSWLWSADHGLADHDGEWYSGENHGKFVSWYANNGLVVEKGADDYIQYGLMSEHHKGDLVWFQGENAQTYFYQSELPYAEFDTTKFGYLVDSSVKTHTAIGIGVYSIFTSYPLDKSKPKYDAAMSIPPENGSLNGILVQDLISMEWRYQNGFEHALKFGNDFKGATSTWGKYNFVFNGSETASRQIAHASPATPPTDKARELAVGLPWPFSMCCNAPPNTDA
jgi:hypothetical protein